jgi:hypothetical protein
MKSAETDIYNEALNQYCQIVRHGGSTIEEIKSCLRIMEYFEDYEKCKDLCEIIKANEISLPKESINLKDANREKTQ